MGVVISDGCVCGIRRVTVSPSANQRRYRRLFLLCLSTSPWKEGEKRKERKKNGGYFEFFEFYFWWDVSFARVACPLGVIG